MTDKDPIGSVPAAREHAYLPATAAWRHLGARAAGIAIRTV